MSCHDELERFAIEGTQHAQQLSESYQGLWAALGTTTRSGRRVRSALLLAAFHGAGGHDSRVVHRVAAAIELLHTAFVIHDDVIDKDLRRRGAPNVSGTFAERARSVTGSVEGGDTLGLAAGVLAGDLALVGAVRELALSGADGPTTKRLLDLLWDAVGVSAAGEIDDVALGVGAVTCSGLAEVIRLAEHKTAVYSFRLPLQAGGVLAGSPEADIERLGVVGRLAGIGYQLVDDLQGVFGDETVTGKSTLGDLREGKMTALMAHARTTPGWPSIARHVGDPALDRAGADRVRRGLEECGSRAFVAELAGGYLLAAQRLAEDAQLAPGLRTLLVDLRQQFLSSAA